MRTVTTDTNKPKPENLERYIKMLGDVLKRKMFEQPHQYDRPYRDTMSKMEMQIRAGKTFSVTVVHEEVCRELGISADVYGIREYVGVGSLLRRLKKQREFYK